ncbi:MAG TPA: LysR family transcriptional regulator [Eubacteriales bacterium]|nr:LysR family transcriptional regulator [Clostridia bacterium]HRV73305.1 LysR family transcriptional regulator [Eubacteriales bacterium]
MELRVLRYFLAVAREENITAAAERLHVTQPTLSKQLMDLEDELGTKLFIRGNRRIKLTEEGMFLRKRAQELIELADKTEAQFHASGTELSGEVFIGGGETDGMRLIAAAVKRVNEIHPAVRFNLYSGNGRDVSERLDKGLLDFGLFVGRIDLKKYEYITLPTVDVWGLLLRENDPLSQKDAITPEDMRSLKLIASRQVMLQNELSSWLGYPFEDINVIGTYNLIFNAALLVKEGVGCALCIDKLVNTEGSGLCFRPFYPRKTAELTLAWKRYQVLSSAAKCFLQELCGEKSD